MLVLYLIKSAALFKRAWCTVDKHIFLFYISNLYLVSELFFSLQSSKSLITHPPLMAPTITNSDATNTTTIAQFNSITQLPIRLAGNHNFSLLKAQVSVLIRRPRSLWTSRWDYLCSRQDQHHQPSNSCQP